VIGITICIAIIVVLIFMYNNGIYEYEAILNNLQDETDLSVETSKNDSTLANEDKKPQSLDSNDVQWPLEIPGVVPRLSGIVVKITEEPSEDQDKYVIYYKNIKNNSLKTYLNTLEEKGWTINSTINNKKSWQVNTSYQKTIGMFTSVDNKANTGVMNIYLRDG